MLSALVAGFALTSPAIPEASRIPLADLALYGDAIVIGRVTRIVSVNAEGWLPAPLDEDGSPRLADDQWAIAEVTVEHVIKGNSAAKKVWYLAQGTWICDESTAVLGEQALFFLIQVGTFPKAGPVMRAALDDLTGGQPVLIDAWSGGGHMPIRLVNEEERVTTNGYVLPPDELSHAQGEPYSGQWNARLDDVVASVENALKARPLLMPAHPVSGLPAALAIVVDEQDVVAAYWHDGTVIWSADREAGGAPYLQGRAESLGELWSWFSDRELVDRWQEPTLTAKVGTRVRSRLPLAFHDLGCPASQAEELRQEILRRLPAEGVALGRDSLELR